MSEKQKIKASDCRCETDASGLELVRHGSREFPVGFYVKEPQSSSVPWHWHDHFEIEYVLGGTARVMVEAQGYTLHRGEGFFVNSGRLHALFPDKDYVSRTVVFHPSFIASGKDSIIYRKYLEPLIAGTFSGLHLQKDDPLHQKIIACATRACESFSKDAPGFEMTVLSSLSEAISTLCLYLKGSSGSEFAIADKSMLRLKQMLSFITEHLSSKIEIEDIARSAHISVTECIRSFNRTVGMPPIQYLKHLRLKKASLLLGATDDKIIDIALSCGFSDMSYFSRAFKSSRGMSPRNYRSSLR